MAECEQFIFPFYFFNGGENILLCGREEVSAQFYKQCLEFHYVNVVGFIDCKIIENVDFDKIIDYKFDRILIATENKDEAGRIKNAILSVGIKPSVVLWGDCYSRKDFFRHILIPAVEKQQGEFESFEAIDFLDAGEQPLACNLAGTSIAFISQGSGLGDAITTKKVYEAFLKIVPDVHVDIYAVDEKNKLFARNFYYGEANVNRILGWKEYLKYKKKYDLAIKAWHTITIDSVKFDKLPFKLSECINRIIDYNKKTIDVLGMKKYVAKAMEDSDKKSITKYSMMSCGGVLPIDNKKVRIELNPAFEDDFKRLGLGKYITMNVGSTDPRRTQLKEWPVKYYEKLAKIIKGVYPDLQIVQIGARGCRRIEYMDYYFLGNELGVVEYILNNSLLHIDCEGGLVHLASQLSTKCLVVFGPTSVNYFGYESNINITANICSPCCWKWKDAYTCLKGESIPPSCMTAITPEMVYYKCENYLKEVL